MAPKDIDILRFGARRERRDNLLRIIDVDLAAITMMAGEGLPQDIAAEKLGPHEPIDMSKRGLYNPGSCFASTKTYVTIYRDTVIRVRRKTVNLSALLFRYYSSYAANWLA